MKEQKEGGLELRRAVDSIFVGHRHRIDMGDIDELADSIDREGLLQPITITPEGVLVCGARRLAAIKKLGWTTVNVWIRSGISDQLGRLLAEQDENTLHKPLTKIEAAGLYRELKTLMAEDAARRKASTQFTSEHQPGRDGAGKFPGPSTAKGDTREQAAAMIPGGVSYRTHEKINYLRDLAADPAQPEHLRAQATADVAKLEQGAAVHPLYARTRADEEDARSAEIRRLGAESVQRATAAKKGALPPQTSGSSGGATTRFPTRAFVQTWGELADWWTHYDAAELAAVLTDEQVDSFLATASGTGRFADDLRIARAALDAEESEPGRQRHLRAL